MSNQPWTPELIDRLKVMWSDGWSCSFIGRELGKTRNAIIGKVHRLQLPGRATTTRAPVHKPIRKATARPYKPSPAKSAGIAPMKVLKPVLEAPTGPGLPLVHVTGCKFAIAEAQDGRHLFCNGAKHENSAWCEYHYRIVYAKSPDKTGKPFQKRFKIPVTVLRAVA